MLNFAAYRQLANLGTKACKEQWGVQSYDEKHRDIHDFAKRIGRLPEQREGDEVDYRGLLHRDGSVISAVSLQVGALSSAILPLRPHLCMHPIGDCTRGTAVGCCTGMA